jgi:quercetin dioxygenase-like cupin family protein
MEDGTSFTQIDFEPADRFFRLGRELGLTSLGLNVIVLSPGQRGRIHRHAEQEEAYVVIGGTLTLSVEEEPHTLGAGAAARVAPGVRRQLANLDRDERCVVVAIGGTGEHVSRDAEAFTAWDEASGGPPQEVPLPPDLF